jgi:hypothetical protein
MGSNPTEGTYVWVYLFYIFVVLSIGSGLALGWYSIQGALPTVYRIKNLIKWPRPQQWAVEPLVIILIAECSSGFLVLKLKLKCSHSTVIFKCFVRLCRGQTALHKAAANKRRSICCMLVAGGASLTLPDHQGNTPRLLALQADDHELAAYLESKSWLRRWRYGLRIVWRLCVN